MQYNKQTKIEINEKTIAQLYDTLNAKNITTTKNYIDFLYNWDHICGTIAEDMGWRYIHTTSNTSHATHKKNYQYFVEKIVPYTTIQDQKIKKKLVQYYRDDITISNNNIALFISNIKNDIKIYKEKNVAILTKLQMLAQKYASIMSNIVVKYKEKEYTVQKASLMLESQDRKIRKEIYNAIQSAYLKISTTLDDIFDTMVKKRHKIALNANFKNFRDYMFVAMYRYNYTPEDCFTMHKAIKNAVIPMLNNLNKTRAKNLAIHPLKPWDKCADIDGKPPIRPLKNQDELLTKTIQLFEQTDPYFGQCLKKMQKMQHLDLFARKNKVPGGYNYPLDITGAPFIFMNATNSLQDIITLIHEGGHAVHSFLMAKLPLNLFKHPTCEVSELASMTMELITMDQWKIFFPDDKELKRAKKIHLQKIVSTLAWISTVDSFQHWIYEKPQHTRTERHQAWKNIFDQYTDHTTDWSGLTNIKQILWQRQLHIFEVPFYYIEYGIAQLGAIAIWKNFKQNPQKTLNQYKEALSLGYTKSIVEIYTTAGISFDFSSSYIQSLMQFLQEELENLE